MLREKLIAFLMFGILLPIGLIGSFVPPSTFRPYSGTTTTAARATWAATMAAQPTETPLLLPTDTPEPTAAPTLVPTDEPTSIPTAAPVMAVAPPQRVINERVIIADWRSIKQAAAEVGKLLAIIAAFLAIACYLIMMTSKQITLHKIRLMTLQQAAIQNAPKPQPGVTIIQRPTATGEYSARRIIDPPGNPDNIRVWAESVLAGGSIAIAVWESAGSPFAGKGEYRNGLYRWIIERGLDETIKGVHVLSKDGKDVIAEYLQRHPTHPPLASPLKAQ